MEQDPYAFPEPTPPTPGSKGSDTVSLPRPSPGIKEEASGKAPGNHSQTEQIIAVAHLCTSGMGGKFLKCSQGNFIFLYIIPIFIYQLM